jgi:hypothetical protein
MLQKENTVPADPPEAAPFKRCPANHSMAKVSTQSGSGSASGCGVARPCQAALYNLSSCSAAMSSAAKLRKHQARLSMQSRHCSQHVPCIAYGTDTLIAYAEQAASGRPGSLPLTSLESKTLADTCGLPQSQEYITEHCRIRLWSSTCSWQSVALLSLS